MQFVPKKISETEHKIVFPHNNSTIFIEGLDKPERIEGTFRVDRIHTTETPNIKEHFLFEHLLPILADYNGIGIFEGCPDFRHKWYRDLAETAAGVPLSNPEPYKGIMQENPDNPDWVWYTWQSVDVLGDKVEDFKKIYDERIYRQEFQAEFIETGGLVYYAFSQDNLSNEIFNPEKPTYLCYDFNVDPMTVIVNQEIKPDVFCAVKEFVLHDSSTPKTTEFVLEWLIENKFRNDLYVTGDYTGLHRDTRNAGVGTRSDWAIIEQILRDKWNFKRADIKPTKSIKNRTNSLNAMFKNMLGEIHQYVNKKECPYLYKDLTRQVYKEDGTLNDEGGKIGHRTDALSYHSENYYPLRHEIVRF